MCGHLYPGKILLEMEGCTCRGLGSVNVGKGGVHRAEPAEKLSDVALASSDRPTKVAGKTPH